MPDDNNLLLVQNQWIRDPNGSSLPRPPPSGNRTPNGMIWGHTMNDFFWVQRRPGINVFTIWSRSMIQEFGENFTGTEHEYEPTPRVMRPWPVLQLPPGVSSDPPLGLVDETCFCSHIRNPLPVSHYDDEGNLRPRVEPEAAAAETGNAAVESHGNEIAEDGKDTKNPQESVNSIESKTRTDFVSAEISSDNDKGISKDQGDPKTLQQPKETDDEIATATTDARSTIKDAGDSHAVSSLIPAELSANSDQPEPEKTQESKDSAGDENAETPKITPDSTSSDTLERDAVQDSIDVNTKTGPLLIETASDDNGTTVHQSSAICESTDSGDVRADPEKITSDRDDEIHNAQTEPGMVQESKDSVLETEIIDDQPSESLATQKTSHSGDTIAEPAGETTSGSDLEQESIALTLGNEASKFSSMSATAQVSDGSSTSDVVTPKGLTGNVVEVPGDKATASESQNPVLKTENSQDQASPDAAQESNKLDVETASDSQALSGYQPKPQPLQDTDAIVSSVSVTSNSDGGNDNENTRNEPCPEKAQESAESVDANTGTAKAISDSGDAVRAPPGGLDNKDHSDPKVVTGSKDSCDSTAETSDGVTEKHSETKSDDPANDNAKTTSIAAKIDTVQTTEGKPVSQTGQESKDPGDDKSKTASDPAQASEKDQETTKAPETAQEVKDSGDSKAAIASDELQIQAPFVPITSLPKLEEFIPMEYLPDVLLVNDPNLATPGQRIDSSSDASAIAKPFKYIRVYPKPHTTNHATPRVAHLNLAAAPLIGEGHHSYVYRARLRLPAPLTARSPSGEVTVAAKTAICGSEARGLLENEGKTYNQFPKHLMEDWCGLNLVSPLRNPVPVGAVVPKFYGYYKRDFEGVDISTDNNAHASPILLLEECGKQFNTSAWSSEQKLEVYSLLLRLQNAGFLQESLYPRNVVVQPGPLWKHPSQRSVKTPSFRFIDFGRSVSWATFRRDACEKYDGKSISDLSEHDHRSLTAQGIEWFSKLDYEISKARGGRIIDSLWDH